MTSGNNPSVPLKSLFEVSIFGNDKNTSNFIKSTRSFENALPGDKVYLVNVKEIVDKQNQNSQGNQKPNESLDDQINSYIGADTSDIGKQIKT